MESALPAQARKHDPNHRARARVDNRKKHLTAAHRKKSTSRAESRSAREGGEIFNLQRRAGRAHSGGARSRKLELFKAEMPRLAGRSSAGLLATSRQQQQRNSESRALWRGGTPTHRGLMQRPRWPRDTLSALATSTRARARARQLDREKPREGELLFFLSSYSERVSNRVAGICCEFFGDSATFFSSEGGACTERIDGCC